MSSAPTDDRSDSLDKYAGDGEDRNANANAAALAAAAPTSCDAADADAATPSTASWTVAAAFQAIAVFVAAGVAEIGGGWLVWQTVREKKPWWWALVGSLVLVAYGFIPTLQPHTGADSFGRVYAVYGGFFIVISFLWGWLFDGNKPDVGDAVGGAVALAGVLVILFWPRS